MKFLSKILLSLCILIAGIYAATPLALSYILAKQLPPGWQLEKLKAGYPGISGITIDVLSVKGEIQTASLALVAADIRFSYRGLKTDIGSVSLDIFIQTTEGRSLTLDDLSLPVTKLTGKMPELSVSQLRMILHHDMDIVVADPLVLDFRSLKLAPRTDNSFYFTSDVTLGGSPGINGRLGIDMNTNFRKAEIRFPAGESSPPWLLVSLEQTNRDLDTTTQAQAVFDAGPTVQEWLDKILAQGTGGLLTHMSGKLRVQADFAGKELQDIEHLSLATENLQAEIDDRIIILNGELSASREGDKITITLPEPAEIQYEDKTGRINDLLITVFPGLQRTSRPGSMAHAVLDTTSKLVIQAGTDPSAGFNSTIKLDMTSAEGSGSLQTTGLQIGIENFSRLDSATANGLITLNWVESAPFTYTSDDLELKADKLSLASSGNFQIAHQSVDFKQAGDLEIQHPVIRLPGDEQSPPMTVTADALSITAELTSHDSSLVSSGSGTFTDSHIAPLDTSADKIDMTWQDLDLLNLAGKLSTKTQGFATDVEGETWSGFDVDVTYTILSDTGISGSGTLKFDSGPVFPIEFAGSTETEKWNITLPPASVKLAQLSSLLQVAHFELPPSVNLTDGYIELQGEVIVDDEITAKMTIKGYEMGASMLESSARKISFSFNTKYADTISAKGPVLIEAVSLAGGIDVSHIRADLNFESTETFDLKNLYAELFDGRLELDNLRFSDNRIEDTTLELSHINLGHLLAYADIDGLEGTGLLEISLPVGSDRTGIYIQNGTFSATGPGRLAYTKEGVAGSNIALQALENFQYQGLSGTINYQADGAYQIAILLDGQNPDLYGGHAIVFNLNISGTLPELFEALFITGDFEESILNQIRTN